MYHCVADDLWTFIVTIEGCEAANEARQLMINYFERCNADLLLAINLRNLHTAPAWSSLFRLVGIDLTLQWRKMRKTRRRASFSREVISHWFRFYVFARSPDFIFSHRRFIFSRSDCSCNLIKGETACQLWLLVIPLGRWSSEKLPLVREMFKYFKNFSQIGIDRFLETKLSCACAKMHRQTLDCLLRKK